MNNPNTAVQVFSLLLTPSSAYRRMAKNNPKMDGNTNQNVVWAAEQGRRLCERV